jgi:hypothetical protein
MTNPVGAEGNAPVAEVVDVPLAPLVLVPVLVPVFVGILHATQARLTPTALMIHE